MGINPPTNPPLDLLLLSLAIIANDANIIIITIKIIKSIFFSKNDSSSSLELPSIRCVSSLEYSVRGHVHVIIGIYLI